jgi:hypothetical protein
MVPSTLLPTWFNSRMISAFPRGVLTSIDQIPEKFTAETEPVRQVNTKVVIQVFILGLQSLASRMIIYSDKFRND